MTRRIWLSTNLILAAAFAQQPPQPARPAGGGPPPAPPAAQVQAPGAQAPASSAAIPDSAQQLRPNYTLQEGDQIVVRSSSIEEIGERPFRIEGDGNVQLPLPQVGPVRAAGLTVEAFENALRTELRKFYKEPQVSVTVTMFNLPPVFMIGAFRNPGVKGLRGNMTLVELLTREGGLAANASRKLRVTRRKESGAIPLPQAVDSPDGRSTYLEINIERLQNAVNPDEDIALSAFDTISVDRAEQIFFLGAVTRVGPVDMSERKTLSVLQGLAIAGGPQPEAKLKDAYILRPIGGTAERAEIKMDLQKIVAGGTNDVPLQPNDIVYIPPGRPAWRRSLVPQLAVGLGTALISTVVVTVLRR